MSENYQETLNSIEDLRKPLQDYYDHFGGAFNEYFDIIENSCLVAKGWYINLQLIALILH